MLFFSQYARYRVETPPAGGYTGGMATLDVSSFPSIKSGEVTAALIWVSTGKYNLTGSNDIQAGWMVGPSHYRDSKTHFFVYWTADGYRSTGCFNLDCTGFVPVNDAPITPGDSLEPANGQSKISFKIFKDWECVEGRIEKKGRITNKEDGDWWLHIGYDINNMKPVGFWPKSLFTDLKDHAELITWGGSTICPSGNASPPVGNGQWPGKNSASFGNVQLVDTNGQGYAPPVWSLGVYAKYKKCYQASTFLDDMFYYGGPGGCVN
ncbi:hypothetical protein EJB05_57774 [Eragrostis curvula]|uniref:Neprosin PEP catalytic domain-containing protein n=1 Tax=Eragrostis curvula TaxID=38414 RepID=A0A5J9SCJ6_9POAL|nr:hypothetical protein EJB05_57774 [Eragrostis curvula]